MAVKMEVESSIKCLHDIFKGSYPNKFTLSLSYLFVHLSISYNFVLYHIKVGAVNGGVVRCGNLLKSALKML